MSAPPPIPTRPRTPEAGPSGIPRIGLPTDDGASETAASSPLSDVPGILIDPATGLPEGFFPLRDPSEFPPNEGLAASDQEEEDRIAWRKKATPRSRKKRGTATAVSPVAPSPYYTAASKPAIDFGRATTFTSTAEPAKPDEDAEPTFAYPDPTDPDGREPAVIQPALVHPDPTNPDLIHPDLLKPDFVHPGLPNFDPDKFDPDTFDWSSIDPNLIDPSLFDIDEDFSTPTAASVAPQLPSKSLAKPSDSPYADPKDLEVRRQSPPPGSSANPIGNVEGKVHDEEPPVHTTAPQGPSNHPSDNGNEEPPVHGHSSSTAPQGPSNKPSDNGDEGPHCMDIDHDGEEEPHCMDIDHDGDEEPHSMVIDHDGDAMSDISEDKPPDPRFDSQSQASDQMDLHEVTTELEEMKESANPTAESKSSDEIKRLGDENNQQSANIDRLLKAALDLKTEKEQMEGNVAGLQETIDDQDARIKGLLKEGHDLLGKKREIEAEIEGYRGTIDGHQTTISSQKKSFSDQNRKLRETERDYQIATRRVEELEKTVAAKDKALTDASDRQTRLNNNVTHLQSELHIANGVVDTRGGRIDELAKQVGEMNPALEQLRKRVAEHEGRALTIEIVQDQLAERNLLLDEMRKQITGLEEDLAVYRLDELSNPVKKKKSNGPKEPRPGKNGRESYFFTDSMPNSDEEDNVPLKSTMKQTGTQTERARNASKGSQTDAEEPSIPPPPSPKISPAYDEDELITYGTKPPSLSPQPDYTGWFEDDLFSPPPAPVPNLPASTQTVTEESAIPPPPSPKISPAYDEDDLITYGTKPPSLPPRPDYTGWFEDDIFGPPPSPVRNLSAGTQTITEEPAIPPPPSPQTSPAYDEDDLITYGTKPPSLPPRPDYTGWFEDDIFGPPPSPVRNLSAGTQTITEEPAIPPPPSPQTSPAYDEDDLITYGTKPPSLPPRPDYTGWFEDDIFAPTSPRHPDPPAPVPNVSAGTQTVATETVTHYIVRTVTAPRRFPTIPLLLVMLFTVLTIMFANYLALLALRERYVWQQANDLSRLTMLSLRAPPVRNPGGIIAWLLGDPTKGMEGGMWG